MKGDLCDDKEKTCDVPTGSIMGPNLYKDDTAAPVGSIFKKHDILFHIHAELVHKPRSLSTQMRKKSHSIG